MLTEKSGAPEKRFSMSPWLSVLAGGGRGLSPASGTGNGSFVFDTGSEPYDGISAQPQGHRSVKAYGRSTIVVVYAFTSLEHTADKPSFLLLLKCVISVICNVILRGLGSLEKRRKRHCAYSCSTPY